MRLPPGHHVGVDRRYDLEPRVDTNRFLCAAALLLHTAALSVEYFRMAAGGLGGSDHVWARSCEAGTDPSLCAEVLASPCGDPAWRALAKLAPSVAAACAQLIGLCSHVAVFVLFQATAASHVLHILLCVASLACAALVAVDARTLNNPVGLACADPHVTVSFRFAWSGANVAVCAVLPLVSASLAAAPFAHALIRHVQAEDAREEKLRLGDVEAAQAEVAQRVRRRQDLARDLPRRHAATGASAGAREDPPAESSSSSSDGNAADWDSDDGAVAAAAAAAAWATAVVSAASAVAADAARRAAAVRLMSYWQIPSVMRIIKRRYRPVPILPARQRSLVDGIAAARAERAQELHRQLELKALSRQAMQQPAAAAVGPICSDEQPQFHVLAKGNADTDDANVLQFHDDDEGGGGGAAAAAAAAAPALCSSLDAGSMGSAWLRSEGDMNLSGSDGAAKKKEKVSKRKRRKKEPNTSRVGSVVR